MGGTGVSYFLHELVQEGYSVDLYEKSAELGGRVHTVQINGRDYETGGSIVHPRNQYAKELVEKLSNFYQHCAVQIKIMAGRIRMETKNYA